MPRILVVDDDPVIRRIITEALTDAGHEVTGARNGREALHLMVEQLPDLVVLDLAMPEMDGWRLLEQLYHSGLRKRTRVVIVSGNLDQEARERGRRESVHHFLEKPFDPDALLTLVDQALEQQPDELAGSRDRSDELMKLIDRVDRILG